MKVIQGGVCAPQGFTAAGVHCGIRKNTTKKDLGLIFSDKKGSAACIYTQNKVKGAPILVSQENLEDGKAQAILVNSGNANTCNADGLDIAHAMCQSCALYLNIDAKDIMIASTGVIGQPLPIEPIVEAMPGLVNSLSVKGNQDVATSFMTTDTFSKEVAISFQLDGKECKMGGIAKGSGMIHPNMATMLSYVTSDVAISSDMLKMVLKEVADDTYNMVTVDGDTSTNDTFGILCNGMAKNQVIKEKNKDYEIFKEALLYVCQELSKMLARDGEGATKLLICNVSGAKSKLDARNVAKSVIGSNLLKCAMYGHDANWGRILCAIGYADADLDIHQVDVSISSLAGKVDVCQDGHGISFDEEHALMVLKEDEITIEVILHDGKEKATAWGCDLTYEYVKINGEYRT